MKRHQREKLVDCAFGFLCGVVVLVVGCLFLQWFHEGGAVLMFDLFGAVGH